MLVLLIIGACLLGCKQKSTEVASDTATTDTTRYFDISHYIQTQIDEVNKTPYFIYKLDVTGTQKDSTPINTNTFNKISIPFKAPDINNPEIKKYYRESIFHDETTKSFTINYTTTNKELEIQSVDILLEEDGETVKRVFLRKFFNYPDSSAIEQLSWKPGESFQINRLVQLPDNKEQSHQTTVVWNQKR